MRLEVTSTIYAPSIANTSKTSNTEGIFFKSKLKGNTTCILYSCLKEKNTEPEKQLSIDVEGGLN